jgi:hypothetical protein
MWVLALGGLSLAVAQACIFCRLPAHDLPGRLARLSSQMEAQWKEWTSPDFSAFALGKNRYPESDPAIVTSCPKASHYVTDFLAVPPQLLPQSTALFGRTGLFLWENSGSQESRRDPRTSFWAG